MLKGGRKGDQRLELKGGLPLLKYSLALTPIELVFF